MAGSVTQDLFPALDKRQTLCLVGEDRGRTDNTWRYRQHLTLRRCVCRNVSRIFVRGPTTRISPWKTLINWGNTCSFVLCKKRPTGVRDDRSAC